MNLLGKLDWSAIPFDQPIIMGASGMMVVGIGLVLGWVTLKGWWPYLWREWLTSVDHKRIGVMYFVLALIMLLRGFADAMGPCGSSTPCEQPPSAMAATSTMPGTP